MDIIGRVGAVIAALIAAAGAQYVLIKRAALNIG
jgi:hypothetical protein